jgi:hypothetical protein
MHGESNLWGGPPERLEQAAMGGGFGGTADYGGDYVRFDESAGAPPLEVGWVTRRAFSERKVTAT